MFVQFDQFEPTLTEAEVLAVAEDGAPAFRASDLAKTIPLAYKIVGAPDVELHELLFPLRDMANVQAMAETA